jgi:predicted HicB family RNase H-like nuclease
MTTVFVRDFPEDLHKRAKMRALEEDLTLRELVIKAVEEYLKRKASKR